ncbi:MAG: citrate lyase subunit beta / citryl-CoA lyase [Actinomycetota bacterium]|nr:citrate lyase subunit beta / citryl-CoA lyase [Actinomycetota bacterium]
MTTVSSRDPLEIEQRISVARSFLFVPGDRPDRVGKALGSGADAIIIDLEDAVRPEVRPYARSVIRELGEQPGVPSQPLILVRVNPFGSTDFAKDVEAAIDGRVDGIVMPKFIPGQAATEMDAALSAIESSRAGADRMPVIGLVESAAGLLGLSAPTGFPSRVKRLAFGAADFYADLRISYHPSGIHTDLAMAALVVASAAQGLPAPLDSPHFSIGDDVGLETAVGRARERGFGGGLCIHPNQIALVNAGFAASEDERAWAVKVLAAWDGPSSAGAIRVGDELVDEAMARRARQIIVQVESLRVLGEKDVT